MLLQWCPLLLLPLLPLAVLLTGNRSSTHAANIDGLEEVACNTKARELSRLCCLETAATKLVTPAGPHRAAAVGLVSPTRCYHAVRMLDYITTQSCLQCSLRVMLPSHKLQEGSACKAHGHWCVLE